MSGALLKSRVVTADATDQVFSHTGFGSADYVMQFTRAVIFNRGDNEVLISFDEDSTEAEADTIPIPAGGSYAADVRGNTVHYSSAAGTEISIQLYS